MGLALGGGTGEGGKGSGVGVGTGDGGIGSGFGEKTGGIGCGGNGSTIPEVSREVATDGTELRRKTRPISHIALLMIICNQRVQ